MIKAQFMQMWDGLETSTESVVVMGATNRPRGKLYSIRHSTCKIEECLYIKLPLQII